MVHQWVTQGTKGSVPITRGGLKADAMMRPSVRLSMRSPTVYGKKFAAPPLGINYFANLRMTFRQNFFLQDWFRNKFGVGLD